MYFSSWNTLYSWALTLQPALATWPLVLSLSWQFSLTSLASPLYRQKSRQHIFAYCFGLLCMHVPCCICIASFAYFITRFFFCADFWPKNSPKSPCLFSCIQNINISNRDNYYIASEYAYHPAHVIFHQAKLELKCQYLQVML